MPREITLNPETIINDDYYIRGINDAGESVIIPARSVSSYASTSQSFAIYDAATNLAEYSETITNSSAKELDVRLEFSGSRTEESYFPYGAVMNNQESAPAASVFDFRLLGLGTFLKFDIEFNLKFANDNGHRLDLDYLFYVECQYPNGDVERRTFKIPNDYKVTTTEVLNDMKLSFSTYIKDTLTDSLMGGKIVYGIIDDLAAFQIITIKDLIVRVKL